MFFVSGVSLEHDETSISLKHGLLTDSKMTYTEWLLREFHRGLATQTLRLGTALA